MTAPILCIPGCCGCWICKSDNFNRDDGPVGPGSPFNWVPPDLYNIDDHRLVIDTGLNIMVSPHVINLSKSQIYKVQVEIINNGVNGELGIVVSYLDLGSFFMGVYDAGLGEIKIYYVTGTTFPDDFLLLNSQLVAITPKFLQVTVTLIDWLIEVAVIDASDTKETCVAPYFLNGGGRVGIGAINAAAALIGDIIVDNYTLCENICEKGCLIGFDVFDAPPNTRNNLDAANWIEKETLATDIDIIPFEDGGVVRFRANAKMFWKHPHPDGHTTMGVAVRAYPFVFNEQFPALAFLTSPTIKLYACVDDPNTPTEWISAELECKTGAVFIRKAVGGVEGAPLTLSGPGLPSHIVNDWIDIYLCIDQYGKVTFSTKNIQSISWFVTNWVYVTGLSGTYCGVEANGSYGVDTPAINDIYQRTYIDQFVFIKTHHEGQPCIVEWTVGGTVEIGDKFIIGITDTKSSTSEQITVIADAVGLEATAQKIYDEIIALNPVTHQVMRSVSWIKNAPNKLRAQDQSDFTGISITKETDDAAADAQTFVQALIQPWIKGAYNCPKCPWVCGECDWCDGPALPPETDTPERLRVIFDGFHSYGLPAEVTQCNGYNAFAGVPNPYGPNWPNFPPEFLCTNHNDYPLAYNGEYILEGCGCNFNFHYPTWYEYYYPDGGDMSDDDFNFLSETCFPSDQCNGFFLHAGPRQNLGLDPTGDTLFWELGLQSSGDNWTFWKSENFPSTECKLPRTLTKFIPPGPGIPPLVGYDDDIVFPKFVQVIPEGSVRV